MSNRWLIVPDIDAAKAVSMRGLLARGTTPSAEAALVYWWGGIRLSGGSYAVVVPEGDELGLTPDEVAALVAPNPSLIPLPQ